jgi:hypothetical protein
MTSLEVEIKPNGKYCFPVGVRKRQDLTQRLLGVEVVEDTAQN